MTSFPGAMGRCSLLAENFCFLQGFKVGLRNCWLLFSPFHRSDKVPFGLFPRKSVNHVTNQSKQTTLFIYSLSPRLRFRTSIPKLSPAMYPFSISLYEHVPLKFVMKKRLRKITKIYLPISIY